jgi:hypothetical protein
MQKHPWCVRAVAPGARKGQAMPRQTSTGTCTFCQGTSSKGTMTRHLSACQQRQAASQAPAGRETGRATPILHLVAEGYEPYWLHFEVRADATLATLDAFLRDIWLECCGHMSQFCIDGEDYVSGAAEELGASTMNVTLAKVCRPGMTCTYAYDFGTTTELKLRVVAERLGARQREAVQVLARNTAPVFSCVGCGQEATQVCTQCLYEDEGWLCDACAPEHACGDEMCLPVVNSPRVGICGYAG